MCRVTGGGLVAFSYIYISFLYFLLIGIKVVKKAILTRYSHPRRFGGNLGEWDRVRVTNGSQDWNIAYDWIAVSGGTVQNTETARSFHNPIGKTTRRITPSGSRACRCCLLPTQHNTGYVEYFSKCLYYAYLYPPFSPGVCHADPHPLSRPRRAASYCSEKFSALPNHFSLGGVIFYMPRKIFPYCEKPFYNYS